MREPMTPDRNNNVAEFQNLSLASRPPLSPSHQPWQWERIRYDCSKKIASLRGEMFGGLGDRVPPLSDMVSDREDHVEHCECWANHGGVHAAGIDEHGDEEQHVCSDHVSSAG